MLFGVSGLLLLLLYQSYGMVMTSRSVHSPACIPIVPPADAGPAGVLVGGRHARAGVAVMEETLPLDQALVAAGRRVGVQLGVAAAKVLRTVGREERSQ